MPPKTHIVLLVAIFLSFCFHSEFASSSKETPSLKLVEEVCNPNLLTFCKDVLRSDARVANASNLKSFSVNALQVAMERSKAAEEYVNDLISNASSPELKESLMKCNRTFHRVAQSFNFTIQGIEKEEYDGASYDCSTAIDYIPDCESVLESKTVVDPLIQNTLLEERRFIDISNAFITAIQKKDKGIV